MPLLFAIKKSQGFSCICPYDVEAKASCPLPGYAPVSVLCHVVPCERMQAVTVAFSGNTYYRYL